MAGYLFLLFTCDLSSFSLTLIYLPMVHLWYLFLLIDSDISYFPSFVISLPSHLSLPFLHLWSTLLLIDSDISSMLSSVISLRSHWHLYVFLSFICDLPSFSFISFLPLSVINHNSHWQCYLFFSFTCDLSYFSLTVIALLSFFCDLSSFLFTVLSLPFLHMWSGISLLTSHDLLPVFSQDPSIFALKYSVFTTFLGFLFCYFLSVSTVSYLSSLWKEPAIPLIRHPSKYSWRFSLYQFNSNFC